MGACCSKEVAYGNYGDRAISVYDNECEQENQVIKGVNGASVRLQGFSSFVSMATLQGKKGVNQDAMTVWEGFAGEKDLYFCGVFDGHGPCGHKVSATVRDHLPTKLSAVLNDIKTSGRNQSYVDLLREDAMDDDAFEIGYPDGSDTEVESMFLKWKWCLLTAFREVDEELSLNSSAESYSSGTTAVTILKQGENLIISNLGDSRAVMCSRGEKGEVMADQLTVDLKPSLPKEADRVRHCNGRVFSLDEESHVLRLWLPEEDYPGLAMTRAFGDFCLKSHGLISIPQVFRRHLTENDEFVVLATDGIWDVLTNFEVVKIVSTARKRSQAAKFLAVHAVRAWKSRFPGSRTDDIAVVILFFKSPAPAKCMSDISHITPDSLSHLNSSISQYTHRSSISSSDGGFDFRDPNNKGKSQDEFSDLGEGETTLNFPSYSSGRHRPKSRFKDEEL